MKGHEIIKMVVLENGISSEDFFGDGRTDAMIRARRDAILWMTASGFSRAKISRIMKRHYDTIRYWQRPDYRARLMERCRTNWHARRIPPREMPKIDTKPILARAMAAYSVTPSEFYGDEISSRITTSRRMAMIALHAAGFNNREIAKITKRHIHTVRYWLKPENREKRIQYKALKRLKPVSESLKRPTDAVEHHA